MTEIKKSETPITGGFKIPKWIIYLAIIILIAFLRQCVRQSLGYNRSF